MLKLQYIARFVVLVVVLFPALCFAQNYSAIEFAKYEARWLEILNTYKKGEPLYYMWAARLGNFYSATKNDELAEPYLQEAISGVTDSLVSRTGPITNDERDYFADLYLNVSYAITRQGRLAEAGHALIQRLMIVQANNDDYLWDIVEAKQDLAVNYTLSRQFELAEPLFEEVINDIAGLTNNSAKKHSDYRIAPPGSDIFDPVHTIESGLQARIKNNYLQMKAMRDATKDCLDQLNLLEYSSRGFGYYLPHIKCEFSE